MKKSTCIITMPRTGSELLINHLSTGLGLKNMGEFLCNSYRRTTQFNDGALSVIEQAEETLTIPEWKIFAKEDFDKRLEYLKSLKKPFIVKFFVTPVYYQNYPNILEKLHEEFNVIYLTRKNYMNAILSQYICERIGFWHAATASELAQARVKMEDLMENPIEFPETNFVIRLRDFNGLHLAIRNFSKMYPTTVLYFEHFIENPIETLNAKFNMKLSEPAVHKTSKLIDSHESLFSNIQRLHELKAQHEV